MTTVLKGLIKVLTGKLSLISNALQKLFLLRNFNFHSGYFAVTSYRSTCTILPSLAVGCTGKACFGVSSRLHWAIRLRLGVVSTL